MEKSSNRDYKIFVYSIIMLIIISISYFYVTSRFLGSFIGVVFLLIPIYLGYNIPKTKVLKYNGILGIFAILILLTPNIIIGIMSGISNIIDIISTPLFIVKGIIDIILFIILGFVGNYLKK